MNDEVENLFYAHPSILIELIEMVNHRAVIQLDQGQECV